MDKPATSSEIGRVVAISALIGGAFALLAFFVLPMTSMGLIGSTTGAAVAGHASGDVGLMLLWLAPLAGATIGSLGAWLQFGTAATPIGRRKASVAILVSAMVVAGVYLVLLVRIETLLGQAGSLLGGLHAMDLLGAGFWLVLLAVVAPGVAAVVYLLTTSPAE